MRGKRRKRQQSDNVSIAPSRTYEYKRGIYVFCDFGAQSLGSVTFT